MPLFSCLLLSYSLSSTSRYSAVIVDVCLISSMIVDDNMIIRYISSCRTILPARPILFLSPGVLIVKESAKCHHYNKLVYKQPSHMSRDRPVDLFPLQPKMTWLVCAESMALFFMCIEVSQCSESDELPSCEECGYCEGQRMNSKLVQAWAEDEQAGASLCIAVKPAIASLMKHSSRYCAI